MKMQTSLGFGVGLLIVTLAAAPACNKKGEEGVTAEAELRNPQGAVVGEATFTEVEGGVKLTFEGHDLPPGPHGFHIHETGVCNAPSFESAGGHFNPTNAEHGLKNPNGPHLGDLPNLEVEQNGTAKVELIVDDVTLAASGERSLLAGDGTALVIHANQDDQMTDPAGNAGDRIACGIIERK